MPAVSGKNRKASLIMWMKRNVGDSSTWQQLLKESAPGHAHSPQKKHRTGLLKKLGIVGFLFFFIKGLLWLAIPALFFLFRS